MATKAGSKRKTNRIRYPAFEDWAKEMEDPQWKDIFTNAAQSKFPRNFTVANNTLVHKRGTRHPVTLELEGGTTANDVIQFFRNAGVLSTTDRDRMFADMEQYKTEVQTEGTIWSEIKNKQHKEMLLGAYVKILSTEHTLVEPEIAQLRETLALGMALGELVGVVLVDGRITEIGKLHFDPEARQFSLGHCHTKKKRQDSSHRTERRTETIEEVPKEGLVELWRKYIDAVHQKVKGSW